MNKRLDIGCGNCLPESTDKEEWVGIDLSSVDERCLIRDLSRGLPFEDNTFDMVRAHNVMEHIDQKDYIFVWNEIYRVLKKDGIFDCMVPRWEKPAAVQDPTHVRFFVQNRFNTFAMMEVVKLVLMDYQKATELKLYLK